MGSESLPMGDRFAAVDQCSTDLALFGMLQAVGLRTTAEKCRPWGSTLASMLLAAGVQASAGHPFAQATIYQKGFF